MNKTEKVFMAIAAAKEIKEIEFKNYIGITPVKVLAINPNKKELSSIYGKDMEEPSYTGIGDDGIEYARVSIICQTNKEKTGIDKILNISMLIRNEHVVGSESGKVQVVDIYGRTAWVTQEEFKNKQIPMYKNGPANISANYRPLYKGEEQLNNFLRTYLNIPKIDTFNRNTGTWVTNANPSECELQLDTIGGFFKGNFEEIQTLKSPNDVRVLVGVRTTDDGKMYQTVFAEEFAKTAYGDKAMWEKLQERKSKGAYATTEFENCPLKEYTITPTTFEAPAQPVNPWSDVF